MATMGGSRFGNRLNRTADARGVSGLAANGTKKSVLMNRHAQPRRPSRPRARFLAIHADRIVGEMPPSGQETKTPRKK